MTKRQTRLFFVVTTLGFAGIFIALTLHSHTRFDALTNAERIDEQVLAGKRLWHEGNCVNCHTLFGEGAYYAPDLTKITDHRGEQYLTAFLQDPSRFYSEQKHRRVMPDPKLDDAEIAAMIAFLDWVSDVDTAGWPPRPILVAGGTFPGTSVVDATAPPGAPGLVADETRGEELYRTTPPGCFACHSTAPAAGRSPRACCWPACCSRHCSTCRRCSASATTPSRPSTAGGPSTSGSRASGR
ncbi:MAG: c-type cytochrome [Gammaproteobacteria bacterium]|jgi:nitric oxide reductase subunit C|nr:c-type cytochrome [Gammaproteobacteria bacterium]